MLAVKTNGKAYIVAGIKEVSAKPKSRIACLTATPLVQGVAVDTNGVVYIT